MSCQQRVTATLRGSEGHQRRWAPRSTALAHACCSAGPESSSALRRSVVCGCGLRRGEKPHLVAHSMRLSRSIKADSVVGHDRTQPCVPTSPPRRSIGGSCRHRTGAGECRGRPRSRMKKPGPGTLPNPSAAAGTDQIPQIKNIVCVMMENHSYDNILGHDAGSGGRFHARHGRKAHRLQSLAQEEHRPAAVQEGRASMPSPCPIPARSPASPSTPGRRHWSRTPAVGWTAS